MREEDRSPLSAGTCSLRPARLSLDVLFKILLALEMRMLNETRGLKTEPKAKKKLDEGRDEVRLGSFISSSLFMSLTIAWILTACSGMSIRVVGSTMRSRKPTEMARKAKVRSDGLDPDRQIRPVLILPDEPDGPERNPQKQTRLDQLVVFLQVPSISAMRPTSALVFTLSLQPSA